MANHLPQQVCSICGQDARVSCIAERDAFNVECPQCGKYKIHGMVANIFCDRTFQTLGYDSERRLLPYLSAYLRRESDQGNIINVTLDNWEPLAMLYRDRYPQQ